MLELKFLLPSIFPPYLKNNSIRHFVYPFLLYNLQKYEKMKFLLESGMLQTKSLAP